MPDPEPDLLDQLRDEEIAAEEAEKAAAGRQVAEPAAAEQTDEGEPEGDASPEWEADERFKGDPTKLYGSYRELESMLGRRNEEQQAELEELRRFRQQAEPLLFERQQPAQPQVAPTALPNGTPILSEGELSDLRDSDPGRYTDLMLEYQAFALQAQMEERLNQAFGPLHAREVDRGARDTLDQLNAELGDEVVARHAQTISRLIREDREHFAHPQHGTRRLRDAIIAAEWEQSRTGAPPAPARPRRADGTYAPRDVHVEGGSGVQPPSAGQTPLTDEEREDQELIESLTAQPRVDEYGVPLPRW